MSLSVDTSQAHWGLAGFCFGVCALLAAAVLTSGMLVPEPEQSIGTTIGEIARDIRQAATGASTGSAPISERSGFDAMGVLFIVTPILAAFAAVLGGISLFRHEPPALSKLAMTMGVGAFIMQYVFWLAVLICGTVLLVSIMSNMGGIFGD
jgi:hypothetical protein